MGPGPDIAQDGAELEPVVAHPPQVHELGVVVWKVPLMDAYGQHFEQIVRCHWDPEKVDGDEIVKVAAIEATRASGQTCAGTGKPPVLVQPGNIAA